MALPETLSLDSGQGSALTIRWGSAPDPAKGHSPFEPEFRCRLLRALTLYRRLSLLSAGSNVGNAAANGCTYPLSASLTSPYTVGSHSAFRNVRANCVCPLGYSAFAHRPISVRHAEVTADFNKVSELASVRANCARPLGAGRGDRTRTCGILVPNQALYQTELRLGLLFSDLLA